MKRKVPLMPDEYVGKKLAGNEYIRTEARAWTKQEHDWVYNLYEQGYSVREISISTNRSFASIQNKVRRLRKRRNTYNVLHLDEKYAINREYAERIKPKTMLDLYCGEVSFWRNGGIEDCKVTTNDKNKQFDADTHERAERIIHKLYYEGKTYDVIDLDPFGSAYDCFDLSVKMAKKGLIVTFGELGHKRLKRLDFVRSHYGIKFLDEFNTENLINGLQNIAARNKKKLDVVYRKDWRGISRVWFSISPLKITEQWD